MIDLIKPPRIERTAILAGAIPRSSNNDVLSELGHWRVRPTPDNILLVKWKLRWGLMRLLNAVLRNAIFPTVPGSWPAVWPGLGGLSHVHINAGTPGTADVYPPNTKTSPRKCQSGIYKW